MFDFLLLFGGLKVTLVDTLGLSRDALHIHVGLILYFLLRVLFRRNSVWVLAIVFALVLMAEVADIYLIYQSSGVVVWSASLHDILNTMVWPVCIYLFEIYLGIMSDNT